MFHSRIISKRSVLACGIAFLGIIGLFTLNPDVELNPVWAWSYIVLGFGGSLLGLFFYHQDTKVNLAQTRRFLNYLGWRSDLLTDINLIRPKHMVRAQDLFLLTDRYLKIKSTVFVPKDPTIHSRWFIHEEYYSSEGEILSYIVYFAVRLPGLIPGWLRLLPEENFMMKLKRDVDLESNQFNGSVSIRAEPERLGSLVMSPTFMEWYLAQSVKPWIHIEDDMCCVSFGRQASYVSIQELMRVTDEVLSLLQKSGSLVKKSEPLFPRV